MISGRSRVCGVIGNPVGHSLSPILQNIFARRTGTDLVYVPFPVRDSPGEAVRGAFALGIDGLNVTVPWKTGVMSFLSGTDRTAADIGAVNTLVREENGYRGYNTDLPGLGRALSDAGISLEGREVLLFGSGGAARAAAYLTAQSHAASLTVLNRNPAHAETLVSGLQEKFPAFRVSAKALTELGTLTGTGYVAFQSTSVGMYPDTQSCIVPDPAFYEKCAAGIDLVYTPSETVFLQNMKKAGAETLGGLRMLVCQGALSFELWNPGLRLSGAILDEAYAAAAAELKRREAAGGKGTRT